MLEELGLGESTSQEEADVIVFNTCTIREKPDQRFAAHLAQARALKDRRSRARDRRRRLLRGGPARAALRALPVRRRGVRPRIDPAPRRVARRRRRGVRAAASPSGATSPVTCRSGASARSRPGCRSRWAATRPARTASSRRCEGREQSRRPGEIVAEVERLAADRSPRGHAARPERQLLGSGSRARAPNRVRRASPGRRTRSTESNASASRARIRRTSASR